MKASKLLLTLILTLCIGMQSTISLAQSPSLQTETCQSRLQTCDSLLDKAAQALQNQQAALNEMSQERDAQDAVIAEQAAQLEDAKKGESSAKKTTWLVVIGSILLKVLVLL